MARVFRRFINFFKSHGKLSIVVIIIALLLQLISAVQFFYTRDIMKGRLEELMGKEFMMKAILVKGMLNYTEGVLNSHADAIYDDLVQPDSIFDHLQWITRVNKHFSGVGLAFVPNYYKDRGRLYEPWTYRDENQPNAILAEQLGGKNHDYTKLDFYSQTVATDEPYWTDPYPNYRGAKGMVTTYAIPIHDVSGKMACVAGVDLSLSWLSDTLNQRHSHASSFSILLTEDGRMISQPNSDHPKYADFDNAIALINDSTVERRKINSTAGDFKGIEFDSEIDGSKAYVYYAFMRGKPHWQLAIVCYDKEVFGQLYTMRRHIFLLMLLGFALLGYIVYRFLKGNKRLAESEMERQRIDGELHVARRIQSEMLPQDDLVNPDFRIEGSLLPAREVGGDLFDYLVRDEKLFFCIGDVSGKGVPSALIMAVTHTMFRSVAARESLPARIMNIINMSVSTGNVSNMFVTFFIGVLDLPTGCLRYCNAGHDTPLLLSDGVEELPVKSNLPLAVDEDWFYEGQEIMLAPGTTLLLYTDGLTEAMNAAHKLFGLTRVKEVLSQLHSTEPPLVIESLHSASQQFVDGAEQSDDLTMLAVQYAPHNEEILMRRQLNISNELSRLAEVNEFVKSIGDELKFSSTDTRNLKLAIEEVVVNIINYAYPQGEQDEIMIEANASAEALRFKITDNGIAFAPTDAPDVDTSLSAEERQIGGLGIFLVRQLMDSINYERVDGKNILTLTKKRT